jgi:hypothetical protein
MHYVVALIFAKGDLDPDRSLMKNWRCHDWKAFLTVINLSRSITFILIIFSYEVILKNSKKINFNLFLQAVSVRFLRKPPVEIHDF